MAARLTLARHLGIALGVALLASACTSVDRPRVQAEEVALPTPLGSFGASMGGTISQLGAALSPLGVRLEVPAGAYRPSEPQLLLQAPRVVRRAGLADPDDGYIVVYQAADGPTAGDWAEELARYLGSGFGQASYAADTQFSVGVLGDTVVFTSWSSRRSDDPARAQAVFDAVAAVGEPVAVRK